MITKEGIKAALIFVGELIEDEEFYPLVNLSILNLEISILAKPNFTSYFPIPNCIQKYRLLIIAYCYIFCHENYL